MRKPKNVKLVWKDEDYGRWSDLTLADFDVPGELYVGASAWQPKFNTPTRRSWESSIVVRSNGIGLLLASSKVDAEAALRRDAERIVKALGGKVVWR